MKNVKDITVVGSVTQIGDLISKLAATDYIKDKSVHMRYMGGVDTELGIKADIRLSSDDENKLNSVFEISKKGIDSDDDL